MSPVRRPATGQVGRLVGGPARRLAGCLALAALAAVVTGPSGDGDDPLAGIRGSFSAGRVALFGGLGCALFGLATWWPRACDLARSGGSRFAAWGPVAAWRPSSRRSARWSARWAGLGGATDPMVRAGGYGLLLALAVLVPLVVPTAAQQSLVSDVAIYALLALGLNVVVGYAGLLDLGYIAFFAIGAYTTAYLTSSTAMPWHAPFQVNPFLALPAALVTAALAGVLLGGPTLRLRGDYLAIVTLGFGEIVQLLANNADGVTGGARGVFGLPPLSIDLPGLHVAWGLDPLPYYYLLLVLIVLVMIVFGRWERSRTGRAWTAIREDEVAAAATGVPTMRMKLLAFAVGASVSGFAGVVLASKQFFNPQTFSLQASLLVLTVVIFGGMGSRLGVAVGAVVLQGLAYLLRDVVPPADRYIYFGAVVVIMMIFRPQGLLPPRARSGVPPRDGREGWSAGAAEPAPAAAATDHRPIGQGAIGQGTIGQGTIGQGTG